MKRYPYKEHISCACASLEYNMIQPRSDEMNFDMLPGKRVLEVLAQSLRCRAHLFLSFLIRGALAIELVRASGCQLKACIMQDKESQWYLLVIALVQKANL
jgi:hypothetical protein